MEVSKAALYGGTGKPMTVKELIEHLQKFPQTSTVVCLYWACSEPNILEEDEVKFYPKGEGFKGHYGDVRRFVRRNGLVMEYNEKTWDINETPEFLDIVEFPGN